MAAAEESECVSVGDTPAWFRQGHVLDDVSRRMDMGVQDNNKGYLYATKKPEAGLCVAAQVEPKDGLGEPFLWQGYVTEVGDLPTWETAASRRSLCWEWISSTSVTGRTLEPEERLGFMVNFFHTLHGQRIKAVGWSLVNAQDALQLTEVVLEFDDNMFYPWKIVGYRSLGLGAVLSEILRREKNTPRK